MISIVIPVYNGEKYLAECIESVLSQTYTDYELLIIDDGSTDSTQKIAMMYKDSNPDKITVYLKGNGGTASALNLGIEKMKGTWFKWLSADDKFHDKNVLDDMMTLIGVTPNHKDYIFYTDFDLMDEDSKIFKHHKEPDRTGETRDLRNAELMHGFYGNGSSSLIHKNILDKCGNFDESLPYDEDLDFWIRACIKYRYTLYHLPIISIDYRTHKESLTWKADPTENLKLVKSIRRRYEQYLTDEQKKYIKKLYKTIPLRRRIIPVKLRRSIVKIYKKGL